MSKFHVLNLRKTLSPKELGNALVLLSQSNPNALFIKENKSLLSDVIFQHRKNPDKVSEGVNYWLKKEDISPPLELLWIFQEEAVLKLTTYLYFHPEYCSSLSHFFCYTLQHESEGTEYSRLKYTLSKIMNLIINMRNNNDFKFLFEEIVLKFISKAIRNFESSSLKWNYFDDLTKDPQINKNSIHEFGFLHLQGLLNSSSCTNNLSYIIGNHTKLWASDKLPEESKSFIFGVIFNLEPQNVIKEINNVIRQESFNWKNLLSVIAIFIKEDKNAEIMKGTVDKWMHDALAEKDKTLLYRSLIVARHCCHEKARYFVNYPLWFGALSLRTAATFSLFFDCLSNIVPDEPPLYLKIHVNKVPSAPSSCQGQIVDYLALAKTRLSDLNETTDYIGLFGDYHDTDEEGQEQDIQRAISLFQKTKEIPKPLLEAAVFRRQYYEKTFLKRLLSLSENEDEQRAELIKKLYSAGKIPSALYRSWSSRSLTFK